MSDDNETLRTRLQDAQQQADGNAPAFAVVFAAAERRARRKRRARITAVAAAAVVATLAIAMLPDQPDEFSYVDMNELTATTNWIAPSDSLLPEHRFDIYTELPRLFDRTDVIDTSTESNDGALL